ncbi:dihydrodipicolinate synthase family protein [Lederbergia citrea]|uniref:Dihydrodipicolinate synthase family protein n=1 Tax=Lederbergia citrea TaxID=2833581 RepID=A0A942Z677_9BACI|nr:dihydrodipicolinate synthase family protein [Lederbergia citrea]MBS4178932.1 dihydrodipicolinate synthase family protein [Lederbergia citrea]MBS4205613.1 dihydrodipicolinate synthase family protein [Lederbergia citrea]MBS4224052.1 dihydrodipicolinate synthase family protein [Lederbergia citrea]
MSAWDLDKFKGVFVAMYSAYDEAGDVCEERVKKLARYYVDSGVKGLYVGGSSGEGILQNAEERKKVLEAVMKEVGEELTIIVHVGANSTRESVELAVHAEKWGADAISAVPAIYYRLSENSVEKHWQEMIDSTSLPFIIYNIPQTTGFHLTQSLFKKMAAQEKVIGIKMSGESVFELQQFKANGGKEFIVYNGPDEQYLGGRMMGADGGIGGTYGVMPELFCQLDTYFKQGEIEKAQALQDKINAIITKLLSYPSLYGATKAILSLRGVETGAPRLPLLPVEEKHWEDLKKLNEEIESAMKVYA